MPVTPAAGQSRGFQHEHNTHFAYCHLGGETLNPLSMFGRSCRLALVFIDNINSLCLPTKRKRALAQIVLALGALRYLTFPFLRLCPFRLALRVKEDDPSAPGRFCIPFCLSRSPPQGDGGPLEFPVYPYLYMPRSRTPVVSPRLAIASPGLLPSGAARPSAFPVFAGISSWTTTMKFYSRYHAPAW